MSFSAQGRSQLLSRLETEEFDLIIIGGGINGAGVARDAASRGLRVALVEADDFASGTSSRSSKLIHGGIRYLENFEFGLVFEALSERHTLFSMAPHLVHPLRFLIPVYKNGRVGMFLLSLGMWVYDALSLFRAPELHRRLTSQAALAAFPELQGEGLLGAFEYSDAYMDDDRLVIETLRSAVAIGAICVNYVRAEQSATFEGKVVGLRCQDALTGRDFVVRGHHIVSTVGPWTDQVAPHLVSHWRKWLRPSKGVHVTFSRQRFPLQHAVVMAAEKRIVFAIPRHEMVIVGTTDTDYPGDPREVRTEREDVDYLLSVIHKYFPGMHISESDILSSYSGVRPLVDDQSETESKTSREHQIISDPLGVTFVAGGKYTTYRKIAEEVVRETLNFFPKERLMGLQAPRTKAPLNPLVTIEDYAEKEFLAQALKQAYHLEPEVIGPLVDRHGAEAQRIIQKYLPQVIRALGDLDPLPEEVLWGLELAHAVHETLCLNLRDFYLRRTPLFLSRLDLGLGLVEPLSLLMKELLNLSDDEVRSQKEKITQHINHELGWRL